MLSFIRRILSTNSTKTPDKLNTSAESILTNHYSHNIDLIKDALGDSKDIIYSPLYIGDNKKKEGLLIYLDGMVNKEIINENIVKPLLNFTYSHDDTPEQANIIKFCTKHLTTTNTENSNKVYQLINSVLYGDTVLLIEGFDEGLIINTKKWENRDINEPQTDVTIRGPREGFTETVKINITMLRRKIINSNLTFEGFKIGKNTNTNVFIAYLKNIANPHLVSEVKDRLNKIEMDEILDSGYIEELIEDSKYSIFPTIANSERPDTIASKILEGKVAILVDGTPSVLTVPMLFIEAFQSPEDYYSRAYYSSFIRFLRFFSFGISILAPAVYIALAAFHQELIPTKLLITMAQARENVPFPAVFESIIMILTFEILKEAGIRLPRPVGQTVSIVGALVLGESAVSAGIIGEPMVIVVAITAIASFVVPPLNDSISLLRLLFIVLAGVLGVFGILAGLLITLIHITSLRSFGTPYFYPYAPFDIKGIKDSIIRTPFKSSSNYKGNTK